MAQGSCKCLLLSLLFAFSICSSGTLVGFSCDARKNGAFSSPVEAISFLKLNEVSPSQIRASVEDPSALNSLSSNNVSVDLYLKETLIEDLKDHKPCAISWVKNLLMPFPPHFNIRSIIITGSNAHEIPMLWSTMKSIHSILGHLRIENQVKVSVSFSVSFLESLNKTHVKDLHKISDFIKKTKSFVILEASVDGEVNTGDRFIKSIIKVVTSASHISPCTDVSTVLIVKIPSFAIPIEASEFTNKVLSSLKDSTQIRSNIIEVYTEISQIQHFGLKEEIFHSSRREMLENSHIKSTNHDMIYPPVNNPTAPVIFPPDTNPTPSIVTVPSTNPITGQPSPASTPVTIPSTTPLPVPSTNPVNPPVPVTNPVTSPGTVPGAQPVTNPVTTYPVPSTGVPVTTPVTSPVVATPAVNNSPAVAGQSWCVAKSGTLETALQSALDYACGIGGADCSAIQQGAGCYNPNTLQNHASYAFNSYYQRNPVQTSCDFGGTAMITSVNPGSGTCVYQTLVSSTSSPITPTTPSPTTASTTGTAIPSTGSPTVVNTSNPGSGATTIPSESPPGVNTSTSRAAGIRPFISCIILVTSMLTRVLVLNM